MPRYYFTFSLIFIALFGFIVINFGESVPEGNMPQSYMPDITKLEPSSGESADEIGQAQSLPKEQLTIQTLEGKKINLTVEIATTNEEHKTGMMFRKIVSENTGMLFIFPEEAQRSFWMKNVSVPLDILFIEKNGLIHHIHPMATPFDEKTKILSNGQVLAVLELGGGEAERLGIQVGDIIVHPAFTPDDYLFTPFSE